VYCNGRRVIDIKERASFSCSYLCTNSFSILQPLQQPIQTLLVTLQILLMHVLRPLSRVLIRTLQHPLIIRLRPMRGQDPVIENHIPLRENPTSTLILRMQIIHTPLLWIQWIRAPLVKVKINQFWKLIRNTAQKREPSPKILPLRPIVFAITQHRWCPIMHRRVPLGIIPRLDMYSSSNHSIMQHQLVQSLDA
jgi:hypothetical protein